MHNLYLVAVHKKNADSPEEAKSFAVNELDINGFSGEGGFYTSCKADWYVVGGRWGGELTQIKHKQLFEELGEKYPHGLEMRNRFWSDEKLQAELKDETTETYKINKEWQDATGTPYYRDTYWGEDDDCQLLTKELADGLCGSDYPSVEVAVIGEDGYIEEEVFLSTFLEETKNAIGNYYIVVIDYHN